MARGASLYICPHPSCGATPYIGDLPGCRSHLHRVHYGTCLLCPFVPTRGTTAWVGGRITWTVSIATSHGMGPVKNFRQADTCSIDHPWCGHLRCDCHPAGTHCIDGTCLCYIGSYSHPGAFCKLYSSLPLPKPVKKEPPVEDTLVYEEDVDPSSSDLSPETEQSLLDPLQRRKIEKPKASTPSEEDIKEAAMIWYQYQKGLDPSKSLAASLVQQDTASPDPTEAPPQKEPKVSSVKVWPRKDSRHTLLYWPPKPDDNGPPSMVWIDGSTSWCPLDVP